MATPDEKKLRDLERDLYAQRRNFKREYIRSQTQARRDLGLPVDEEFLATIRSEAEATVNTIFGEPIAPNQPTGFGGDFYSKTKGDFALEPYKQYAPTIKETVDELTGETQITTGFEDVFEAGKAALSPQARMPEGVAEKPKYQPMKLDWMNIKNTIQEQTGDEEKALSEMTALQEAFGVVKTNEPDLSDQEAFQKVQQELRELQGVISGETRPFLTDPKKGPADPLYQAFQGQLQRGEIPDFSPIQMAYLKSSGDKQADIYINKNIRATKENPTIEHVRIDGSDYPKDVVEYIKNSIPGTIPTIYSKSTDEKIRTGTASSPGQFEPSQNNARALLQVQAYGKYNNDAWYLDPDKKDAILKDPEAFIGEGYLTQKTAFGGTKETDLGWFLRSAFSPVTVLGAAGLDLALEAGSLVSDDLAYIQEQRRQERAKNLPDFENYPGLASLATGRGITGDLMQIGEGLNLDLMGTESYEVFDPTSGEMIRVSESGNKIPEYVPFIGGRSVYATSWDGASLLVDLADPSYALIGASVKGPQTYLKTVKAQKKIYGAPDRAKALNSATKEAIKFVDDDWNMLSGIANRTYKAGQVAKDTAKTIKSPVEAARRIRVDTSEASLLRPDKVYVDFGFEPLKSISKVLDEATVGDVRLNMGTDLSKSLKAREMAKSGVYRNGDDLVQEMKKAGVDNSQYGRAIQRELKARGGDVRAAEQSLDATGMLSTKASPVSQRIIQQNDATQKLIDDYPNGGWNQAKMNAMDEGTAANQKLAYESLDAAIVRAGGKGIEDFNDFMTLPAHKRLEAITEAKNATRYLNASDIVFTETPNLAKLKGVKKVTRRLFADEGKIPKILEDAANSSTGQLLTKITQQKVFKSSAPEAIVSARMTPGANVPFAQSGIRQLAPEATYDLSKLTPQELERLNDFVKSTDISEALKTQIVNSINTNKRITFSDMRLLNERNIESVAMASGRGVGLDTVSRLPPDVTRTLVEKDLLKEILSLPGLRQVRNIIKEHDPTGFFQDLTPAQRQLVKDVQQEVSGIDVRLKRDLIKYKNQGKTGYQAIGSAIIGEVTPENIGKITSNLQEVTSIFVSRIFFKERKYEQLIDRVWGYNQVKTSNLLNQTGQAAADALVLRFSQNVVASPDDFLPLFNQFLEQYKAIATDPANLVRGVNPNTVGKQADDFIEAIRKDPARTGIIFYTNAETNRIVADKVVELLENESKQLISKDVAGIEGMYPAAINAQENFYDGIRNYTSIRFNPTNVDIRKDLRAAIEGFINDKALPQFQSLKSIPDETTFFEELAKLDPNGSIYDAGLRAVDYGNIALARNGFKSSQMTADDLKYLMDDIFRPENENLSRLIFGDLVYDDILSKLNSGAKDIGGQIDKAFGKIAPEKRALNAIGAFFGAVNSFRYTFLLGSALRFHGVNNVTAQGLIYATTGRFVNASQIKDGMKVVFGATYPGEKYFAKRLLGERFPTNVSDEVATSDIAGRQYTYGEINKGLLESGVRSEYSWMKTAINDDNLVNFMRRNGVTSGGIDWMKGVLAKPGSMLEDFTTAEDLVFRAAVVVRELEAGKSFDAALEMGRRSLFDYNDLYAPEKALAAYLFMFYNFQRQSFVAAMQAVMDGNVKPYINTMKFQNGMERMLIKDNEGKAFNRQGFLPDYMASKIVLKYDKGVDKDWVVTSPPLPAIDSLVVSAEILKSISAGFPFLGTGSFSDLGRVPKGMLNPNFKMFLGEDDEFETKKVNRTYAQAILSWDDDPMVAASRIEYFVGGRVTPRISSKESGGALAADGSYYVFPLNKEQAKAYDEWIGLVFEFSGLARPANDYTNFFMPEGSNYQKLSPVEGVAAGFGLITPSKLSTETQRSLYDLYARKAVLEEELQRQKNEAKKAKEEKKKNK